MTTAASAGDTAIVQKSISSKHNVADLGYIAIGARIARRLSAAAGVSWCALLLFSCDSFSEQPTVEAPAEGSQAGIEARAEELKREIDQLKATLEKKNAEGLKIPSVDPAAAPSASASSEAATAE